MNERIRLCGFLKELLHLDLNQILYLKLAGLAGQDRLKTAVFRKCDNAVGAAHQVGDRKFRGVAIAASSYTPAASRSLTIEPPV